MKKKLINKIPSKINFFKYYKKEYYKFRFALINFKKKGAMDSKRNILEKVKNGSFEDINISIKTPNPKIDRRWGDYFYAVALKKSFEKKGFNVSINEKEEWYNQDNEDIVLLLRGLTKYNVDYNSINLMWNISHPNEISKYEYETYDIIFVASERYNRLLKKEVNTNVETLLQCFDPDVFYPKENDNLKNNEILFVGSTRHVFRDIIKDISNTSHDFSVFGPGWNNFIDEKYIKEDFIPNDKLNQYYSSCKILLNDHWDDMKELGFISNRLFDALGCGTFIISDKMQEVDTLFEGNVITYEGVNDLNEKINYYLEHDDERNKKAVKGREIVLNNHTFDYRVNEIIQYLKNLKI